MTAPDVETLRRLEASLVNRDAAGIAGGLPALVADDFLEFGASGRVWDAETTKRLLADPPGEPAPALELLDFDAVELAPDVVLVTYSLGAPRPANRASIWVRRDGRWQIRFHQGTLRPDDEAGDQPE